MKSIQTCLSLILIASMTFGPIALAQDARRDGALQRLEADAVTQQQQLATLIQRVLETNRYSHANQDDARALYLRDFNAGFNKAAADIAERRQASLARKSDTELREELETLKARAAESGNRRVLLALENLERDTTRTLREKLLSVDLEEQRERLAEKAAATLAQFKKEGKSVNQMLEEVKLQLESGKGGPEWLAWLVLFPCTFVASLYVPAVIANATGSLVRGVILGLPFLALFPATVVVDFVIWWPIFWIFVD